MSPSPAINGVEERLDVVIAQQAELIGLLQSLASCQALAPSGESETVELREPLLTRVITKRTPPAKKQHKKRK